MLPNAGGRKIFVHLNEFPNRRAPQVGALITFEIGLDANRRSCAVRAQFVASPAVRRAREQVREAFEARADRGKISVWLAGVWTFVVMGFALYGTYPWKFVAAWVAVNVITFFLYATDKNAAEQGRWRTRESHLHLLALTGGWPAAAIAQQGFRHKTSKDAFRAVFWLSVVANVAAMLWLASEHGAPLLSQFR